MARRETPQRIQSGDRGLGRLAPTRSARTIAAGPPARGSRVAFPVGDATAGEVVGADLNQHLVSRQQLDPELGELASGTAQALVASRLLEGDQMNPLPVPSRSRPRFRSCAAGEPLNNHFKWACSPSIARSGPLGSASHCSAFCDPSAAHHGSGTAADFHRRDQSVENP